jgi:hypothetical protein
MREKNFPHYQKRRKTTKYGTKLVGWERIYRRKKTFVLRTKKIRIVKEILP